jgi:ABC-type ATPase with predicted acetyltransferase domain
MDFFIERYTVELYSVQANESFTVTISVEEIRKHFQRYTVHLWNGAVKIAHRKALEKFGDNTYPLLMLSTKANYQNDGETNVLEPYFIQKLEENL